MPSSELLDIGGGLAIVALVVRELFAYLKSKGTSDNSMSASIFKELQTMNNNHLHSIQGVIESGNNRVVDAINDGNRQMIQILGEIKGAIK
jgi:hypothetical protein